jgi:hypothetical protein
MDRKENRNGQRRSATLASSSISSLIHTPWKKVGDHLYHASKARVADACVTDAFVLPLARTLSTRMNSGASDR